MSFLAPTDFLPPEEVRAHGGAWDSVGMGSGAQGARGARWRGQDGGMRLSIAWSPLYSGSNSKGLAGQSESDPMSHPTERSSDRHR
jgi:hypothetical protein